MLKKNLINNIMPEESFLQKHKKKIIAAVVVVVVVLLLLVLIYVNSKVTYTDIVCEGRANEKIKVGNNKPLTVKSVIWGRDNQETCRVEGGKLGHTSAAFQSECAADVTKYFQKFNKKNIIDTDWGTIYKDLSESRPCPGTYRYLTIKYQS
jgi:hypothetical protein